MCPFCTFVRSGMGLYSIRPVFWATQPPCPQNHPTMKHSIYLAERVTIYINHSSIYQQTGLLKKGPSKPPTFLGSPKSTSQPGCPLPSLPVRNFFFRFLGNDPSETDMGDQRLGMKWVVAKGPQIWYVHRKIAASNTTIGWEGWMLLAVYDMLLDPVYRTTSQKSNTKQ